MMQRLPMKLALTASIATLLWAIPVSLDLGRSGAPDPNGSQKISIGLKVDSAQARIGRPATPRSAAGVARRTTRRAVGGVGYAAPVVAGAAVAGTAAAVGATAAARRCTTVVTPAGAVRRCVRVY
jgi:hypothetical protein